ncbi:hypothetical protein J2T16_002749 [Paenibacillus intestini]|nr:hypothetical protein [Paenibacillus intestini]
MKLIVFTRLWFMKYMPEFELLNHVHGAVSVIDYD